MKKPQDITFETYLADPAYGSGDVHAFRKGPPAAVRFQREQRRLGADEDTAATRLGRAVHCALLTPDLFGQAYVVRPDGIDFRTKAGKQWRDQQPDGITLLSADDGATIANIIAAVQRKPVAIQNVEQSVFWTDPSGLPCKGRPDWFDRDAVYDLKVSVAADKPPESREYACMNNGWLHQLAHNRAGLAECGVTVRVGRLVLVSPNPPHFVHLLEIREHDMDFLELSNQNTRRQMMACHKSGGWPGTPDSWETIELPAQAAFTESSLDGADEEDDL